MKKKVTIKPIIASVLTLMASFTMMPIIGYANENDLENVPIMADMNNAFAESKGEYDYIEKKIEEESENVTGLIDEDVEKVLNNNGVLDADIEKCSKEELQELEKNIDEDSMIYVSYYAINDIEELSEVPVQKDEMIQLTTEQVDEYIAEKYYEEDSDLREELDKEFAKNSISKNDSNMFNVVSDVMGLHVTDVHAKTITHGGISDKVNTTMLREILVVSEIKNTNYIHAWFKFEWTEMPKYREVDTISLGWSGANYEYGYEPYREKNNVVHTWYCNYIYRYSGKVKMESGGCVLTEHRTLSSIGVEEYNLSQNMLVCVIDLHDDIPYRVQPEMIDLEYEDESIAVNLYLMKTSPNGVNFYPEYRHLVKKYGYNKMNLLGVTACLVDYSIASMVYTGISGITVESVYKNSGPQNVPFYSQYK